MIESRLRNFRTKHDLLYSRKITDEERNRAADAFLQEGRFGEALEFIEATRDPDRLARVLDEALGLGDTFLLLRVEHLRGEAISPEEWRRAGETALARGKAFDAYRAFGRAGDDEKAETIRAEHMPGYQPFKPEGK